MDIRKFFAKVGIQSSVPDVAAKSEKTDLEQSEFEERDSEAEEKEWDLERRREQQKELIEPNCESSSCGSVLGDIEMDESAAEPSYTNDSDKPSSKCRKSVKKLRKYSDKWLLNPKLREWIQPSSKGYKPYCKYCDKILAGSVSNLEKHASTKIHLTRMQSLKNQVKVVDGEAGELRLIGEAKEKAIIARQAIRLEIAMTAWIVSNNKEISTMDSLPGLMKKFIPDSSIVKHIACGRTKTTCILKNVIAPYAIDRLSLKLRACNFSLIVDESTDKTGTKFLVMIARHYDMSTSEVKEDFLALPVVTDASAAGLKKLIYEVFRGRNIPLKNLVGFASDNASVMLGKNNGLAAQIKKDVPWLSVFGCICHSFALCSAAACEKLPAEIVKFSNDIYTYVSNSAKRLREFKEFQEFCNVAEHALLYPSATRWLAFEAVADRLLEQWEALILFFTIPAQEGRDPQAAKLYGALKDPSVKLYYFFLAYVLPTVNRLNLEFQSTEVKVHRLLKCVGETLTEIARNFINDEGFTLAKGSPFAINFTNPRNFKNLEKEIYFGAQFEMFVFDSIEKGTLDDRRLTSIKKNCLTFYIALCSEIKTRIDSEDPLLKMLDWLSPKTAMSGQVPSIIALFRHFQPCFEESINVELLNREWRRLPLLKDELDAAKGSVQKFWNCLSSIEDGTGDPAFTALPKFMRVMMSLPHSSASAERQFSTLKMVKTPFRNRLLPDTISDIMHVKREVPDAEQWNVPDKLITRAKKWKKSDSSTSFGNYSGCD